MFAFSSIRRHIFKLPCRTHRTGFISESGIRCWYRPSRMEKNPMKCLLCGVEYHSESDKLRHLQGKRHKSSFDKELGVFHKSVEVHWDSSSLDSKVLKDYISQFGKMEKFYNQGKNYALVYFNNSRNVQNILQRDYHTVDGVDVNFKQRTSGLPRSTSIKHKTFTSQTSSKNNTVHTELMQRLSKIDTMSEQMKVIRETLMLQPHDITERKNIAESLTNMFRKYIPACTVHLFGSSVNGFGMKGADIDLFLDLHEEEIDIKEQTVPRPLEMLLIRTAMKKMDSKRFNFYDLSLKDKIFFTGNVLRTQGSFAQNVFCITTARCPLTRFKHISSGLNCDITINNRLALNNTKLLTLFSNLDERVRDLVYTVRYWAKIHQLSVLQQDLSSYALTSMVIIFLQNTNPLVLPKLQTLKGLTDEIVTIENMECSFQDDIGAIPKTNNTDTAGQLFLKFLDFYKQFDFKEIVLKCNSATAVPLEEFYKEMKYHPYSKAHHKFKFGEMNVQDPFVLTHNIAKNVTREKTNLLKMCLNSSSKEIEKCLSSHREKMALIGVLDVHKNFDTQPKKTIYSFPINLNFQQEVKDTEKSQMSDFIWCVHACKFVEKLFTDVLYIDVNVKQNSIMSEIEIEKMTRDSSSDSSSESFASQVLFGFHDTCDKQNKRTLSDDIQETRAKRAKTDLNNPLPSSSSHFEDSDVQMEVTRSISNDNVAASTSNNLEKDNSSTTLPNQLYSLDLGEIVLNCTTENVPLKGRPKIKKEIKMEQIIQDLALEKEISKRIRDRGDLSPLKLTFECVLKPSISHSDTKVTVSFEAPPNPKLSGQFDFLCNFLKTYILNMFKNDLNNDIESDKSEISIGGKP